MKNRVIRITGLLLVLFSNAARADQFNDFKSRATQAYLKPFARDIGGLIGGGAFHAGRALGFPGVDAGVHMTVQSDPSKDDRMLKDANVKNLVLPIAQGEIGLPYNFDVIVRGFSYQEVAMVGGGLRYGLFKLRLVPLAPAMSVAVMTDILNHNFFSITHYSANVSFDVSIPIVSPYLGFGIDHTRVKVKEAGDTTLVGAIVKVTDYRAVAGLNLKPFPFVYLHGGYTLLHGQGGYETGLGIRF